MILHDATEYPLTLWHFIIKNCCNGLYS